MKSIAANLLGNTSDAEHAVQETFLKIYRASSAFQGGSRLTTWIYRILVNSCYDVLRRRRRRAEETLEDAAGRQLFSRAVSSDEALRIALERSLAQLPPRARAAFLFFEVEGFSHREIGEILGIPEASSRTLLFDAKKRLQRLLWSTFATERVSA